MKSLGVDGGIIVQYLCPRSRVARDNQPLVRLGPEGNHLQETPVKRNGHVEMGGIDCDDVMLKVMSFAMLSLTVPIDHLIDCDEGLGLG